MDVPRFIALFYEGDQISIADVHAAAWLTWVVHLSGGSVEDSGCVAIEKLQEHVGDGFSLPKDTSPLVITDALEVSDTTVPIPSTPQVKLSIFWDALKIRPSWNKIYGNRM